MTSKEKENFKDKEQRLEKNFSRLLDRYNKSKTLIDDLYTNVYQERPQSHIQEKPRKIKTQKHEDKENYQQQRMSSIDNLHKLKQTLDLKQNLDLTRSDKMKHLNKELKSLLHQSEDHIKNLEMKLKQRDELLKRKEEEILSLQDQTQRTSKYSQDIKMRDESTQNQLNELKETNTLLKSKVLKKKQTVKSLKTQLQVSEKQQEINVQRYGQELEHLQRLCEQFSNEIREHEQSKSFLTTELNKLQEYSQMRDDKQNTQDKQHQDLKLREQELGIRLEQEIEKRRDIQIKYDQQVRVLEDTKETLFITDAKVSKMKLRSDDERSIISKEFVTVIEQKKEKINKLKQVIQEQEQQFTLKQKEIDTQYRLVNGVQIEMDKQMQVVNDYKAQVELKNQEIRNLMQDVIHIKLYKKIKNHVDQLDRQAQLIQQFQSAIHDNESYRTQELMQQSESQDYMSGQDTKIKQLYTYNEQIENQLQRNKHEHLQEMDQIEIKIEEVLKEMNMLKSDNSTLKLSESSMKKQITLLNDLIEQNKQKYLKQKDKNEQLLQKSKYTEDKVKQYESERQTQQKEMMQKLNQSQTTGEVTKNKIKALDEIQGLISQFKQR